MKLVTELMQLPLSFDSVRLNEEVSALAESAWINSSDETGDRVVPLIAPHGKTDSDSPRGPMKATPFLEECLYIQQVLATFNAPLGQCLLVRRSADRKDWQVDRGYYQLDRVRIILPLDSEANITLAGGSASTPIQAGEAWLVDTWKRHRLLVKGAKSLTYLVIDSVGSPQFWNMSGNGQPPGNKKSKIKWTPKAVDFVPNRKPYLLMETRNFPRVMSPWEMQIHIQRMDAEIAQTLADKAELWQPIVTQCHYLHRTWWTLWSVFGDSTGFDEYQQERNKFLAAINEHRGKLLLDHGEDCVSLLENWIANSALNFDLGEAKPEDGQVMTQPAQPKPEKTDDKPDKPAAEQGTPFANDAELVKEPLRCVNTTNFPKLLNQLGISLVVSTYQAGKLIFVRTDGSKLNTHFRSFQTPMGLTLDRRRLVVGTRFHVMEYLNQPEVAAKLEPANKHDACYLPLSNHVTGDIRIHELGIDRDKQLWIVNTRFSCLCTLDGEHSFVPRWRPPFVTALSPEDRCHLNGLAMVNGRPKYVTALGITDTRGGWRENKANGGILMDIDTGEILLSGLSMPHSPRWYRDKLWILESGEGSIANVDLSNASWEAIAEVPGFTRGIDFYQNYAFIGLSQVRESATFSGIPITERLQERTCGVWVIDLNNGKTVGFLRFESGVREIFAVQVLPNVRFPDLIHDDNVLLSNSFVLPKEVMAEVVVN